LRAAAVSAAAKAHATVDPAGRRDTALKLRTDAAGAQYAMPVDPNVANGDELAVPRFAACFTKGLPTGQMGEAEAGTYESLRTAVESGKHADFEAIRRGSGRRLTNPQAAFSYCLEGGDPHRFACPPAPAFSSAEMAGEMVEMYWLALARDVAFRDFGDSEFLERAGRELKASPRAVFRIAAPGVNEGPYVSQFLARPVPMNSTSVDQRYRVPVAGSDHLESFGEWLQIQGGVPPWREYVWEAAPRYIRSGRDLAEWVHYDYLYQAFLNAALILMNYRPETVLSDTRYVLNELNPYKHSKVQDGFTTFGVAQMVDWLGRVTTAALKAAWAQKWLVHRRLRPEAFGGRIHQTKTKVVEYSIHSAVLDSAALEETYGRWGTYLLPQAYPEGSPLHPSYPGGHATVAGACAVVLKAMFDEGTLLADCVHASADGLSLEPCPPGFVPTAGAEINKLVSNISMGRSWAGIHYRSDSTAGIRLGEDVAMSILQDLVRTCTEDFDGFAFTRFDGTAVKIGRNGEVS
jgi:hypothetical protein